LLFLFHSYHIFLCSVFLYPYIIPLSFRSLIILSLSLYFLSIHIHLGIFSLFILSHFFFDFSCIRISTFYPYFANNWPSFIPFFSLSTYFPLYPFPPFFPFFIHLLPSSSFSLLISFFTPSFSPFPSGISYYILPFILLS